MEERIGDSLVFTDLSEYMPIEQARSSYKDKEFDYVVDLEKPSFSLKRIS
jgi:hypothetical protein